MKAISSGKNVGPLENTMTINNSNNSKQFFRTPNLEENYFKFSLCNYLHVLTITFARLP